MVPDSRVEWLTEGSAVENILNDGHLYVYDKFNYTVKLGHSFLIYTRISVRYNLVLTDLYSLKDLYENSKSNENIFPSKFLIGRKMLNDKKSSEKALTLINKETEG